VLKAADGSAEYALDSRTYYSLISGHHVYKRACLSCRPLQSRI